MDRNDDFTKKFIEGSGEYVDRMIQIRRLSSPDISGVPGAEEYSSVLLDNFRNIGMMAEQNRALIEEIINPFLDSKDDLDPEMIRAVEELNEKLLDATVVENIDLPLAKLLTDRLLDDANNKDDVDYRISVLDREIENCYLLINMTKRVISDLSVVDSYRDRGFEALRQLLRYLDKDSFLKLSPESRETVMTNARYGAALYESMESDAWKWTQGEFSLLERALKIADDPFYREAMPDFDWDYQIFRIYDYLIRLDYSRSDKEMILKALEYVDRCVRLWKSDPERFEEYCAFDEIEGRRYGILYLAGKITKQEYREKMYELFLTRDQKDYSVLGFDLNIEYPQTYIQLLDDDIGQEEKERIEEIYRSALSYIFHMPKLGMLSLTLDPYSNMLVSFRENPGYIDFMEMGISSFAAFHPPTYIHSNMVAKITGCLASHLLRIKPELFSEVYGYLGLGEGTRDADVLLDFAYKAALCHDFGKLLIIDTIFVYGRRLFDMEFDLIKHHPDIGCELLSKHDSTKKYAEVARGHHLWYDGSRGYPSEFDVLHSPVKIIIDLVAIADCMDAATDSVGRSYSRGKTFDDFRQEVIKDAGTRYAPWGPELLSDEECAKDLEQLLSEGRMRLYRETYTLLNSFV